ncbi:zinc finger BED domain-containing 1-like protein [Xyrichtys novacula]|uniref:Zinc finger BED domain-containing 1-like protein n=1 Tax=Xyrichtys novacula TaxID=13765 RepID=A0AAV1EM68_XYRNO|nr:zinc finger BED domain-containing 1-like protein [Xyrichtys novacula]
MKQELKEYELCRPRRGSTSSSEESSGTAASTSTKQVKQTKLDCVSCQNYNKASKRHKDITHAVTCFIARDILPITTVEKPGFDQLLATLDPRLKCPAASISQTQRFRHENGSGVEKLRTEYELCRPRRDSTSSSEESSGTAASTSTKQEKQTKLDFVSCQNYDKASKDITHAVTCSIARDILPVTTVEKPGCKQLLATLDPRYEVPGRKYFSNTALQA